jgi:hypothetical protein
MRVSRWDQSATILTNGEVFFAGGYDSCSSSCVSDGTTELFNPQGQTFTSSQVLSTARSGHTATLLTDGSVLLVGGINNGVTLSSTESYQPSSLALPQLASITIAPSNQPLVLGTTLALTATGSDAYGDNLGPLQSVTWNSSSPSVADISNAAGSAGIVNSLSVGTTTITASVGTISATTQVTVTAPLASIVLSPTNPTLTLNSAQEVQLTATGIYMDSSTRDLTADVSWHTSNSSVATVIPNPAVHGIIASIALGTTNITATFGTLSASTSITVVAPPAPTPPSVVSALPNSGTAGTPVTVSGLGFGSQQGNGVIFLGSTLGRVTSWTDTQIVATVNTGSASGVVQVQQSGLPSNSVPFVVNTPTVVAVSPAGGLPGTPVTFSGSGFGATQGNGMVWIGTAPANVTSWTDEQVVATVAPGSTSGNAQILQNGVWSNAMGFTIDSLQIANISPNSGSPSTPVTITGSGFGTVQGSGSVWIGGVEASILIWGDGQVIASVPSSAVSGVVRIEQNAVWSNAIAFIVPLGLSGGTSITVMPSFMSMVAGDTRSVQALDANGQSVSGLNWTSSDATVATLSTDDPPIITAIAPGHVTIDAGVASAALDVFAGPTLPVGTQIWSNPGDGSGVIKIVPAVPSSTGVADVFSLQASGNVQAIKSDGTTAWTSNVGTSSSVTPDFQGGLVVVNSANFPQQFVQKLDGITGQPYPAYTAVGYNGVNYGLSAPVVHTDGTIFVLDGNSIVGIDPITGNPKFPPIALEQSISSGNGNCGEYGPFQSAGPAIVGTPIIAGDGYAYFPYWYSQSPLSANTANCYDPSLEVYTYHTDTHSRIMRVGTDGSSVEISVDNWILDSALIIDNSGYHYTSSGAVPTLNGPLGSLITNSDQGVLYSWAVCLSTQESQCTQQLTTITNGSLSTVSTNIGAGSYPINPILQRADGSYIGTVNTPTGNSMVAFTTSGQQLWNQPNYTPRIATSGGGLIAQSQSGQSVTFDTNGNQTGQIAILGTYSWTGANYQVGSVDSFQALLLELENSYSGFAGANASGNNTAVNDFPSLAFGPGNAIWNAYTDLIAQLSSDTTACSIGAKLYVFSKFRDANGYPMTRSSFVAYLTSKTPEFLDGTASTWDYKNAVCGTGGSGLLNWFKHANCSGPTGSVKSYFANNPDDSAATETPSYPFLTFLRPSSIETTNSGKTIDNEALLFHEALHGMTGLYDEAPVASLELNLTLKPPSQNVTNYIKGHVLSICPVNLGGN